MNGNQLQILEQEKKDALIFLKLFENTSQENHSLKKTLLYIFAKNWIFHVLKTDNFILYIDFNQCNHSECNFMKR